MWFFLTHNAFIPSQVNFKKCNGKMWNLWTNLLLCSVNVASSSTAIMYFYSHLLCLPSFSILQAFFFSWYKYQIICHLDDLMHTTYSRNKLLLSKNITRCCCTTQLTFIELTPVFSCQIFWCGVNKPLSCLSVQHWSRVRHFELVR